MKIATILVNGKAKAAVLVGDRYVDLQATEERLPSSVRELLDGGAEGLALAKSAAEKPNAVSYPAKEVKILPPIPDPRKIVCLGLNYKDHAAEQGVPLPQNPVLFSKYATALIGTGDSIVLPAVSQEVDFEAELVIVVGKRGRHISASEALSHVAGYMVGHDVSARDWQLKKDGKQWMVGKTFDTFAPTGPHLVTADEVGNAEDLGIRLRLNGETMQDSSTSQLVFGVAKTLEYLSTVFTLEPGDLIFTGTPPGVGFARDPKVFLKDGDVVEVEIDKLGVLRNPVIQEKL